MKKICIIFLITFTMCKNKTVKLFEGTYTGDHSGIAAKADLKEVETNLTGTIFLNEKKGILNGTINGTTAKGTIKDEETGVLYPFSGSIEGKQLKCTFIASEANDQAVELILFKDGSTSDKKVLEDKKERNGDLIGTWKNSEILGSGEMTFATESFMEFNEDGSMRGWTGRSAGSGTSMESDEANAKKVQWYTDGNKLYFIDPSTKQEDYTMYSVSETGLLLHNGGSSKKVYQRVQ